MHLAWAIALLGCASPIVTVLLVLAVARTRQARELAQLNRELQLLVALSADRSYR